MKIPLYQVDAFASKLFEGNPAAVCPLPGWLPDALMQSIAAENNLAETAFFVPEGEGFAIRWFTPLCEVELCGHATLASAFVLFHCMGYKNQSVVFSSLTGSLTVEQDDELLILDFPAQPALACDVPDLIAEAFGVEPVVCLRAEDWLVVFDHESIIEQASPDMELLKKLELRGVAITAPSQHYDFVARFFAPKAGIAEDPVTGSAYTQLAPYWATRLGKKQFSVKQLSTRGGELSCEMVGDRVKIAGSAVLYLEGSITI